VSAGKSTLVNLLVGRDVLPTGILPTTRFPLRLQYGRHPRLGHAWAAGLPPKRCFPDSSALADFLAPESPCLSHQHSDSLAEVFLPAPLLRTVLLLDTPGLHSFGQDNREITKALEEADAAMWCVSAVQRLEGHRSASLATGAGTPSSAFDPAAHAGGLLEQAA
jgi:hypothetical protein